MHGETCQALRRALYDGRGDQLRKILWEAGAGLVDAFGCGVVKLRDYVRDHLIRQAGGLRCLHEMPTHNGMDGIMGWCRPPSQASSAFVEFDLRPGSAALK
jgi:hypothetical protein